MDIYGCSFHYLAFRHPLYAAGWNAPDRGGTNAVFYGRVIDEFNEPSLQITIGDYTIRVPTSDPRGGSSGSSAALNRSVHVHDYDKGLLNKQYLSNVGFLDGHLKFMSLERKMNTDRYIADPFFGS